MIDTLAAFVDAEKTQSALFDERSELGLKIAHHNMMMRQIIATHWGLGAGVQVTDSKGKIYEYQSIDWFVNIHVKPCIACRQFLKDGSLGTGRRVLGNWELVP